MNQTSKNTTMIELQDFMVATLKEFIAGIRKARSEMNDPDSGLLVAPFIPTAAVEQAMGYAPTVLPSNFGNHFLGLAKGGGQNVYSIEFDVAVTYSQESGGQIKVGVLAGVFGASAGADMKDAELQSNHVKFMVPIALPTN